MKVPSHGIDSPWEPGRAFDRYLPQKWRHRFATFADDVAAGANTLEELFELLKAIIECFDKAGIQVKASKLVFGVQEISFHNYTISGEQTRPKDENLDPIRNCAIPQSVTNVKAFLGCTQQMSHYCHYYGIIAAPLHELTRDKVPFPKPWLEGTEYDISFMRLKSMMLNDNLFLWNKVSDRRLFIEVDACEFGWGACVYQYAHDDESAKSEDEGRHRLLSKEPKRIVEWISKAWTEHERELPCFYREALARLLCLEHFRNLIETQSETAGTTVYTDHAPSTYKGSLSNKGRLSSWRIHETSDLADMVQTLYKAGVHLGPPHSLADPLSRLPRGVEFYNIQLPAVIDVLLERLPESIKNYKNLRVNAEKDTVLAARMVQRWRNPRNPISVLRGEAPGPCDFLITAPFADKITHSVAKLIRDKKNFAALVPVSLLCEIDRDKKGKIDPVVAQRRSKMTTIVISQLSLAWLVSHPECTIDQKPAVVLFSEKDPDLPIPYLDDSIMDGSNNGPSTYEAFVQYQKRRNVVADARYVEQHADFIDQTLRSLDNLMKDGAVRHGTNDQDQANLQSCYVQTRTQKANAKLDENSSQKPVLKKGCKKGLSLDPQTFKGCPDPDPYDQWIGNQDDIPLPTGGSYINHDLMNYPKGLKAIKIVDTKKENKNDKVLILVPENQRDRIIKQEHLTCLHVGAPRILHALEQKYYWPGMKAEVEGVCQSCPDCVRAMRKRKSLHAEFNAAKQENLPMPRQNYGIDFYGHHSGNILVAIDLVTREITLWFMKTRKQETVAKALLAGLVFTKGVPLSFRSDEASEFVHGVVAAMNAYLGVTQITTGGHNARGNATVERVMHSLGHMLRTAPLTDYKNIGEYVHCMAFAHNCTYSSVIQMSPFEAGHGLAARTISEARMDMPRLQLTTEEGSQTDATKLWEKGLSKKVIDLAHSMAEVAQKHSEWNRRMTSEKLHAGGKKIDMSLLKIGQEVYFYKPPTQDEVFREGRDKKHLYHYHGPAKIVSQNRERQFNLEYNGKPFTRDVSMIVPEKHFPTGNKEALITYDPTKDPDLTKPRRYKKDEGPPTEGEIIICNESPKEHGWFVAEVTRRKPNEIEVKYLSTFTPPLEDHDIETLDIKVERILKARFRRTWFIRQGKNAGKATIKPPYTNNEDLRAWTGRIPHDELNQSVLLRGIKISPEGQLSVEAANLAAELSTPHEKTEAVEDVKEKSGAPSLFLISKEEICNCQDCKILLRNDAQDE